MSGVREGAGGSGGPPHGNWPGGSVILCLLAWLWHLLKSAVDCVEIRMMRHVSEAVHVPCVDGLDVNTFYSQHVTISIRLAEDK